MNGQLLCRVGGLLIAIGLGATAVAGQGSTTALPQLQKRGAAVQLIVDGVPFLVLGGELHNSSSSSLRYMEPLWSKLADLHLNTVLVPVSWELIEPEERKFDFALVDGLIRGAREHRLRLVLLWFGSWKNTYSSYVPAWVKRDVKRFPRVELRDGRATERLSPFSETGRTADARAFAALMHHVREVDANKRTILMVQVENEVGVIPESRDHSAVADAAFDAPVPPELATYIRQHAEAVDARLRSAWEAAGRKAAGTWSEFFGPGAFTDDLFMAWHFAKYTSAVVAAGKREYSLPMFANAALIRPNYVAGQYNSGGPLPHSRDVWRAAAPNLDFIAPDIYFRNFVYWAEQYVIAGNPLFVPEAIGGQAGAANALYAFGRLNAIGFSPFGVEDEERTTANMYATLSRLAPMILEKQTTSDIAAVIIESDEQRSARVTLGDYTFTLTRAEGGQSSDAPVAALFLRVSPDEYVVAGCGKALVSFATATAGPPQAGIISIDEEVLTGGSWSAGRRLNGDENAQGQLLRIPAPTEAASSIFHVKLYRYR